MSGKPGRYSTKPTDVENKYHGAVLDKLDGRVRLARTLRERMRALTNDLGGVNDLSYQEQSLCKRAVHLERLLERKESALAHGGTCDESTYLNSINALSGLYSKLGLRRRAKQVLTLQEYVSRQRKAVPAPTTTTTNTKKPNRPHASPVHPMPDSPSTTQSLSEAGNGLAEANPAHADGLPHEAAHPTVNGDQDAKGSKKP
jgi:hypothetical protein